MKYALFFALVLGIVLLAGCTQIESLTGTNSGGSSGSDRSSGSNWGSSGSDGYGRTGAMPEAAPRPSMAASPPSDSSPSYQKLIKTANAEVEVPSGTLQERYAKFKAAIASLGGQIVSSDYRESETLKEYDVQVKIPPSKFENLATLLQGIGKVEAMSTNVEDVSEQYVDIETRIRNLQIQRGELIKLYDRNGTLEEIMSVQEEVARVQTKIEGYQNQKLNIDRRAAMSSVQVNIYEQAQAVDRTVLDPLGDVANAFLGALAVAILVISAILGFGIPVLVAGAIIHWGYRRFRPKKAGDAKNRGGKK